MYINVLFHSFFPFRFFVCLLLSFLGKTFKLRQKWIWWLELHFATLVRLAFRLGRDDDECFPKTFVQIFFPRLFFYFISILKVQNSQKVLMWSSYPQTDKPKHKPCSWNFENAALWFKLVWMNVSTTPITAMGCRQCLPLSVVQLKGKHCRKLHCRNGVVDTFGQSGSHQAIKLCIWIVFCNPSHF